MNNTLYLVTGAAGFLGSNVASQLLERGDRVRAFVLPGDKAVKFVPDEVEIVYGDITNPNDVEKFFKVENGMETVCIHVASMVTVNPEYSQKVMDVNVGGAKNIVEVCKQHPECKKLVYVSSTGAIPELPKGTKIKEVNDFSNPDPKKVVGCYSQSKALATQVILDAAKDGVNACVVHPSGIIGPNDFSISTTTKTVIEICKGEMPVGIVSVRRF